MAKLYKAPMIEDNYTYDAIGKNSEVFSDGDLVTTGGGAGLRVAVAGDSIIGVKAGKETMTSTNQTVALVKPGFQPIDMDYEYAIDTNADLNALTSVGATFNITGTTGAQLVDVAGGVTSGSTALVICTKVDPSGLGGTGVGSGLRKGVFKIVKVIGAEN